MKMISVDVVLALPARQELRRITVPENATVADALSASGILAEFPSTDACRVGIYGKPVAPGQRLEDGDRVEIYRPLKIDPMERRLRRAKAANGRK
jgi:putative ubiquitin-RnfH superfamily antitoxin RatB of RatAB toxin-antitoxin module